MKVGLALGWQNSDWDRYDADDFSRPPAVPDWEIYRENLRLLDLAEPLGFDSIFSIEHHMTPYHMTPSGPQLLAYLAGRTERIDLGTALIVVPWYNPVRLAEQVCFLDNVLDEGRNLWLGVGRGTAPREYQAMGIDQNEARERFKEGIDILRLALTEERFSYHGKHYQRDDISVRPRPRRADLVDRLYAGVITPQSLEITARMGLKLMFTQSLSFEDVAEKASLFNSFRAEEGFEPIHPIMVPNLFCASSVDEAVEYGVTTTNTYMMAANKHYEFAQAERFANIKGYEQWAQTLSRRAPSAESGPPSTDASTPPPESAPHGLFGTPEMLIERLQWIANNVRPSQVVVITNQGGIPPDAVERSLRLFAKEVLPVAQAMDPAPFATSAAVQ
jgi:alkanesulfonate monooxygenase SsuD/methylene tetrahydromethanopterin reductase-like flavin-dependent oxidoreductase (luciferase family)